ncbi:MAG: tetratricopeptide repeat protein [Candidatus Krumholzibacteria bacterium]|nr:tetratricopeptide repeat protein [Candidatus Krumholzibacteria bacterium]
MRARRLVMAAALIVLSATGGCGQRDDVSVRYALERQLWRAQLHERRINIAFLHASQRDLASAIEAFEQIVAVDPFAAGAPVAWRADEVARVRRIVMVSKIALANLYFFAERYYSAGDAYARALQEDLTLENALDVRLNLARSLYLAGEEESLEQQCGAIFREIVDSEDFWGGGFQIREVFLRLPLVLVRLSIERGDDARAQEMDGVAERFYRRIRAAWPDSLVAAQANVAQVHLRMAREQWRPAVAEIEVAIGNRHLAGGVPQLRLLRAEILAFALKDRAAARGEFASLIAEAPGTPTAHVARFDLAVLALDSPSRDEGMDELRALENAEGVNAEVRARAMLVRAKETERQGSWDEAIAILRRILSLHPYTEAAMEAPMVATRHYIAQGEEALARRSLERGRDFYLSLMDRGSKYTGDRLAVTDFLVENYLLMGQAEEVAQLLQTEADGWDEASAADGMFKSALIYSALLDDSESAVRILEKCIEMFPETRYAKIAQRQLAALDRS